MKGVRGLEGGVGMLVGTPMGTRRRNIRAKGEKIIRGTEARGPVEARAMVGVRMGEDSKGVRVSDAEADDVIAKRVAMGDR